MKAVPKILFLFVAFLFAKDLSAATLTPPDSSAYDLYEDERINLLKRISFEKTRIAHDFKSADSRFFAMTDSVIAFIMRQPVTKDKRNIYLNRLQMFLSNVNRYYSDSYFKSGTYLAVLSYFSVMIEWDENDDLTNNIKRYSDFTIKAARLIPNEIAAEDFLVDYMNDNPDDVFRYAEEFDDRKFALRVLEKATKLAPESAKRYYTSGNTVSDLLRTSKDPYVKKSLDIYDRFGLRSRAYLLLDEIVKNNMSMQVADSFGIHPNLMFSLQVGLCMKYDAPITYSSNRFIDMYCVETMRKINQDALIAGPGYNFEAFSRNSTEEMFQLLNYGFKETTPRTFPGFFEILRTKAKGATISSVMIANMDKEKLKDFVIFCYKNKVLDQLLALVDDNRKEYLLALTTYTRKETLTPPFMNFNRQADIGNGKPEDQSLKGIVQARPPKAVAPDVVSPEPPSVKPSTTEVKPETSVTHDTIARPAAEMTVAKKEIQPVPEMKTQVAEPIKPTTPQTKAEVTADQKVAVVPVINQPVKPATEKPVPQPEPTTVVQSQPVNQKKEEPVQVSAPIINTRKATEEPVLVSEKPRKEILTPDIAPAPVTPVKTKEPEVVNKDLVPVPIPEAIESFKVNLDERTRAVVALKKNILQTIQNIPAFINKDYAEEVLLYAAQKEPDELLKKIGAFKGKFFCKKVLEECAINAPVSIKRYLYNPHEANNYILQYSQNPVVKKIFEINPTLGYQSKPLLLLDDIVAGKMSTAEAITVSNDPNLLFSTVVKIISRPKYIGKYSINREMRDYSLRFIREINEKIATGAQQPFSSVENFGSADLYFLMLYGRDEVFTSTFTGLFNRFIQKLPKDNGEAFLGAVNYNQFRDFISLCANYGTLEEFLTKFSPVAKEKLLQAYVSKLEAQKDDLSSIVLVAEAISNLRDNSLLTVLQESIKKEYERVKSARDQFGISIYGVLSSMISGNAKVEAPWYKSIAQQFKISPVNTLASTALFNDGNVCAEQMFFYDDDDGRSSFINFMNSYKNQNAWGVEDKNSYVRIYSRLQKKVEILANKPGSEENGVSAINDYFKANNLVPTVVVHRGHSFHTESTLQRIPATTRLLFVGSCGGFYKISVALENAPDAHIISTKQVGTKSVNDVMLYALNENIRSGKDIDWNEFWGKMSEKLGHNQYFGDYVPPHKNLEAIFIRAYYKILGV